MFITALFTIARKQPLTDECIKKRWYIYTMEYYSAGEEFACNAGDPVSIPGSEDPPGEENGNPLQYSCLESSMDRGDWRATVHRVTKSWTQLKQLSMHGCRAEYIHSPRVRAGCRLSIDNCQTSEWIRISQAHTPSSADPTSGHRMQTTIKMNYSFPRTCLVLRKTINTTQRMVHLHF